MTVGSIHIDELQNMVIVHSLQHCLNVSHHLFRGMHASVEPSNRSGGS